MITKIFFFYTDESTTCLRIGSVRIDSSNFILFISTLIFYIAILVLLFLFRNEEPLRSRSLGPFIGLLCQFVSLIGNRLITNETLEFKNQYGCYVFIFCSLMMMELSYIIPYLIYFRSFLINNINEYKEEFYVHSAPSNKNKIKNTIKIISSGILNEEDEDDDTEDEEEIKIEKEEEKNIHLNWKYYILSKLISPFFIFIVIFIYFIFIFFLKFLIFLPNNFKCNGDVMKTFTYEHLIIALIISFLTILLQVYDLFLNRNLILRCKLKQYFFINDQHYFRIDIFNSILSSLFYISFSILVSIYLLDFGKFLTSIIMTFVFTYILFSQVLFTLLITVYKKIKNLISKNKKKDEIDLIFQDEEIFDLFLKHTKDELSTENIYSKLDIKKYKKSNKKKKEKIAIAFQKKFLKNSCLTLNVSNQIQLETSNKIDFGEFTNDLFDQIESEVDNNLQDTITRFSNSSRYQNFIKLKKFKNLMFNSTGINEDDIEEGEKKNLLVLN